VKGFVRGEDCLKSLAKGRLPDIILLVIMLPGMKGYEMCRILKMDRRYRSICIIMFAGNINRQDIGKVSRREPTV
jgi:CheY-like chemotaxis protein